MSSLNEALRVSPGQTMADAVGHWQCDSLDQYLSKAEQFEIGSVLLVPTYRLEEVEEVIEPKKPEVPVEPYVGLSWVNDDGTQRVVLSVSRTTIEYAHNTFWKWSVIQENREWLCDIPGYPHTLSTPAVTRKVKKWVKITDSPEC